MKYCSKYDCENKASHIVYNLEYSTEDHYCRDCSNEFLIVDNMVITEIDNN